MACTTALLPEIARDFVCARKGKDIQCVTLDQGWFLAPNLWTNQCGARFHEGAIKPLKVIYTKSPSGNWVTTFSFVNLGRELKVYSKLKRGCLCATPKLTEMQRELGPVPLISAWHVRL